jgi:RNA polymerase sigma factor (TIGR02999 family)
MAPVDSTAAVRAEWLDTLSSRVACRQRRLRASKAVPVFRDGRFRCAAQGTRIAAPKTDIRVQTIARDPQTGVQSRLLREQEAGWSGPSGRHGLERSVETSRGGGAVGDVTLLLQAAREGESLAVGRIFELLYPELRRIAHGRLRYRDDRLLMDTGSLVNEAYLQLLGKHRLEANDRGHFLAYAAQVMRNVVVDAVRAQRAERRGGGLQGFVTLDTAALNSALPAGGEDEILRVHEALEELALIDARLVRVVEMRYFVGLSNQDIADSLGVTTRTVERDWEKARTFLYTAMRDG